jgi:DNA-binding CsgD family transcriptional regulator
LIDAKESEAGELWESMRETDFPFALFDPSSHLILDTNDHYAQLFDMTASQLKGRSILSLYASSFATSIEGINDAFARGTLQSVRGQVSIQKATGETIELDGWSRRLEGISSRPMVVTAAVDTSGDIPLPDDRYWVAQAPHVFGLPDERPKNPESTPAKRSDQLEQHLWRIAVELRTAGFMPVAGETLPLSSIKEFGELSPRQREIVTRLVAGERVSEIARAMYLSPSTIRNHLTAAFRIFGVHSQMELISVLKSPAPSRP